MEKMDEKAQTEQQLKENAALINLIESALAKRDSNGLSAALRSIMKIRAQLLQDLQRFG